MTYATRSISVPLRRPAPPVSVQPGALRNLTWRRVAGELAFIVGLMASVLLVVSMRFALASSTIVTPAVPVVEAAFLSLAVAVAAFYLSSRLKGNAAH